MGYDVHRPRYRGAEQRRSQRRAEDIGKVVTALEAGRW